MRQPGRKAPPTQMQRILLKQQQTNSELAALLKMNMASQARKISPLPRKDAQIRHEPKPRQPDYGKERADFIAKHALTGTVLERMEKAFTEAYGKTKNRDALTQKIMDSTNITHAKAYAFTSWALSNKWPNLTKDV